MIQEASSSADGSGVWALRRHEWRRGTHECVRYKRHQEKFSGRGYISGTDRLPLVAALNSTSVRVTISLGDLRNEPTAKLRNEPKGRDSGRLEERFDI
jgi:hypothetical protein